MPDHLIEVCAAIVFAIALIHTFSTSFFEHLAHTQPRHADAWHLLGEVEVVFGLWAMVLIVLMFAIGGKASVVAYMDSRNFTEPMFVFVIMVIAGTRPVLQLAAASVRLAAGLLPMARGTAVYFLVLSLVPLLGSFITEPAAMTVAALMLRDSLFRRGASTNLKYATLGVLFVNISIGGTLTPFAAPPVIMVSAKWNWDLAFMLGTFGWKAAIAVLVNATVVTLVFRRELLRIAAGESVAAARVPPGVMLVHVLFLCAVVVFGHHPEIFIGILLFFIGYATAYQRHQDRLILREALLVAFFLAGLVVLSGLQQWWLQPLLLGLDAQSVFYGATALTAIADNAALTYLGSMVEGLSDEFKVALVAGAVTGGGLTIIANAPNLVGAAMLKGDFHEGAIHPLALLLAALPPTFVAVLAFRGL